MVDPPNLLTVDGSNDPQDSEPQVAVQIMPEPIGSFETCAETNWVVFASSELGGVVVNWTVTGVARIVRLALLLCDGLLVTVAVIVTVVPTGTADGAVKTVGAPSPACAGLSVPHAPFVMLPVTGFPPHITVQSTPALALSPDGVMLNVSFELKESALAGAVTPVVEVIAIGPAFAAVVELPPHPESAAARAMQPRSSAFTYTVCPNTSRHFQRTSTGKKTSIDTKEITNRILFLSVYSRLGLRFSVWIMETQSKLVRC